MNLESGWLIAASLSWRLSGRGGACHRNPFSRYMSKRVTNSFFFGHRLKNESRLPTLSLLFLSSSVVEQSAVNRLVVAESWDIKSSKLIVGFYSSLSYRNTWFVPFLGKDPLERLE
ncbi:hypothetical protein FXO38_33928, partial [Capsicum annuum]